MRFMMFIKHTEDYRMEDVPKSLFEAMGEFVGESMKKGLLGSEVGLKARAPGRGLPGAFQSR